MVYPSLIAAVSDASHPSWRARSLSVYRLWRDLGYAIGALSAGLIADRFGLSWAIVSVAGLTFVSGTTVALVMREHQEKPVEQDTEPHGAAEGDQTNIGATNGAAEPRL